MQYLTPFLRTLSRMTARAGAMFAVCALAGCAPDGRPPIHAGEPLEPSPSSTCPFGLRGARVAVENTRDGADVVMTAFGDATELRHRARDAAAMYGPGAHRGLGHHGQHGDGKQHGLSLGTLGVQVVAAEEDTPDGARIHVASVDPQEKQRMRAALVARVDDARTGECK
jgi:hypothetical protein